MIRGEKGETIHLLKGTQEISIQDQKHGFCYVLPTLTYSFEKVELPTFPSKNTYWGQTQGLQARSRM